MFYAIQKDSKFLSLQPTPTWADKVDNALATSNLRLANELAERYGGKPVPFEG